MRNNNRTAPTAARGDAVLRGPKSKYDFGFDLRKRVVPPASRGVADSAESSDDRDRRVGRPSRAVPAVRRPVNIVLFFLLSCRVLARRSCYIFFYRVLLLRPYAGRPTSETRANWSDLSPAYGARVRTGSSGRRPVP